MKEFPMKTTQQWGYKDDGSAQIFDLKEGEKLPAGWDATPKPWNHPNSKHLHPRPPESSPPAPEHLSKGEGIPDFLDRTLLPDAVDEDAPTKPRRGRY